MKKVLEYEKLEERLPEIRKKGKIVLVGGCFDIVHPGHIAFFEKAKQEGDTLIVLVESDKTVHKIKGEQRPINNQNDRARTISALHTVDFVIPLPFFESDENYFRLVKTIKPDIIAVTSGDPLLEAKTRQAEAVNGRIVEVIKRLPDYSTTKIADKIKNNL